METLSVIIPSYRRPELTAIHVRECMNSTRIPDEIVVVNDAGPESLREMLVALPKKTRVVYARVLQDIPWNYNGAMNLGVWLSRGNMLALEDSDHIPRREAYDNGMKVLEERKEISRVAFGRHWVELSEVLVKPFEEWTVGNKIGPNQMVSLMRREVYLKLKGQDERFCGRYGYMAYDWVLKYKQVLQLQCAVSGGYYIVRDGSEPDMKRGMSSENRRIYRENCNAFDQNRSWKHSKYGILNFQYVYEIL